MLDLQRVLTGVYQRVVGRMQCGSLISEAGQYDTTCT